MKPLKKYLVILSLLLLASNITACSLFTKEIVVPEYISVPQNIPIKSRPAKLKLFPVHFDAVSHKNLNEFLAANKFKYGENVFISMDVRDYENLSLNQAELRRYILQQKALIEYYESRIIESQEINNEVSETK